LVCAHCHILEMQLASPYCKEDRGRLSEPWFPNTYKGPEKYWPTRRICLPASSSVSCVAFSTPWTTIGLNFLLDICHHLKVGSSEKYLSDFYQWPSPASAKPSIYCARTGWVLSVVSVNVTAIHELEWKWGQSVMETDSQSGDIYSD
jgi:hypothetical protein